MDGLPPSLKASLLGLMTSGRASGPDMYAATSALGDSRAQQGMASMGMPTIGGGTGGGVDIAGALGTGAKAAGGMPGGDDDGPDMGSGGDMSFSPEFMAMVKHAVQTDDAPLTSEDKGLALAQAGFGMAASHSPHFGQALGEGAVYGIQGLREAQKQRAQERMKRDAMLQTGALREEAMAAQRAQAAAAHDDRVAANARQKLADEAASADRQDALGVRRDALEAVGTANADKATALAEQHYQTQANNRMKTYYTTGQWQALPGDDEHGVTGAPTEGTEYEGPLVTSPKISLKQKQALEAAKPDTVSRVGNAVQSFSLMDKAVDDILKHPGLAGATGATSLSGNIPGTDWKDAKALIDSLKNKTATSVLTNLRAASKSGGALGNVSNADIELLKNNIASLDTGQKTEQVVQQLKEIQNFAREAGGRQRTAYVQTYGDKDAPALPWETAPSDTKTLTPLERAEKTLKDAGN